MSDLPVPISQQLPLMVREARRQVVPLTVVFAAIALTALAVGLLWPKKYAASTTILVSEDSIIQPLMEGRAVPTSAVDRAGIAREVVYSRKVLERILEVGGWSKQPMSEVDRDRLVERIKARISLTSPRENLIQIGYWDSDPTRAYTVASGLTQLFIDESRAAKQRESREAYEFISKRASEYHAKLVAAEDNLKAYRAGNLDARPGSVADLNTRVSELRRANEQARLQVMELSSRASSLEAQLSGESAINTMQTREGQYLARLAQMSGELDSLRLQYTDEHPDVIRVRHQIADLEQEIAAERSRAKLSPASADPTEIAPNVRLNPVYQQLRLELANTRREIAGAQSRIGATEALLQSELDRGARIADSENKLAELTRDYEVNREIYQDLLRRRENARVSMNLDEEGRGLSFTVQEPAMMPVRPSGVRFMHFAAAGLVLALAVPAGLLAGLVRLDPRVRSARDLERIAGVPVLATVPTYLDARQRRRRALRATFALGLVAAVALAYGVFGWIRLYHAV